MLTLHTDNLPARPPSLPPSLPSLGMTADSMGGRTPALGRFLCPVGDCSFTLQKILEDLQRDSWPVPVRFLLALPASLPPSLPPLITYSTGVLLVGESHHL